MNGQAQEVLTEMLQRVLNGVDSAVEFSQAQIPDVVEQLLMWRMLQSLFPMLFFSFLTIILTYTTYRFMKTEGWVEVEQKRRKEADKQYRENQADYILGVEISAYTSLTLSVVSALIFVCNLNLTWLQIWIAPKLYLLEYAAELAK